MDAVIKKIPYGMTDFERIILENYYYVDKTQYIAKVEKVTSFFFFVRPRRFGKSLFLNMLGLYYDINQKDKFEKIFGNLYIGKHPTDGSPYSADFQGADAGMKNGCVFSWEVVE